MGDLTSSAVIHADQKGESKTPAKNQGALHAEGKERSVFPFTETESVSEGVSEFLQDINEQRQPESLQEHVFTEFSQETIEVETEIAHLFQELEGSEGNTPGSTYVEVNPKTEKQTQTENQSFIHPLKQGVQAQESGQKNDVVYSSIFSLAHSFNKGLSETRRSKEAEAKRELEREQMREETRVYQNSSFSALRDFENSTKASEDPHKQEKDSEDEHSSDQQKEHGQEQQQKQKKQLLQLQANRKVNKVQAVKEGGATEKTASSSSVNQVAGGIESIYFRFMALMARILGQAEAEAHALYIRIKERTDSIDLLTLLVSKLNSEKGAVDWSNNEEMKQLIQKARELGVDIPEGKYKWSEEEKKFFKENIQMRKDSMEKVTQLERTDMQRYLQEASQCHQARSNILKLIKEVMDTIIHNMRP